MTSSVFGDFTPRICASARVALVSIGLAFFSTSSAWAGPGLVLRSVADFNQDGISDLLAEKIAAPNLGLLWTMLVDGSDASADGMLLGNEFPIQLQNDYAFLAVGNFDGNLAGQSQIAARKTAGTPAEEIGGVRVWDLSDDASMVTNGAEGTLIFIADPIYDLIGVGDVDGNGVDDFVFIQGAGANPGLIRVYLMNSEMAVQQIAHALIVPGGLEVLGVADASGDGIADIVVANRANQNLRIFLMDADVTAGIAVQGQRFAFSVPDTTWDFAGFANFTAPGGDRADLIFRKNTGANEGLLRVKQVPPIPSQGTAGLLDTFHPANLGAGFDYVGHGLLDSDTETDLILSRNDGATAGQVRVLVMNIDVTNLATGTHVESSSFPVRIDPTDWSQKAAGPVAP